MDEVLREFVTEALDSVESVDRELVRFEQEPTNAATLANIFRLVHTVKGTCGFLDLPRLEALSHAAESLISQFRDGAAVTSDAVTLILQAIDRIKLILRHLEQVQVEPDGDDRDLIAALSEQPATFAAPVIPVLTEELAAEPGAQADVPVGASPAIPAGAVQGQSIRVGLETLESLMTMVSELVLTRNQLIEIARRTDNADFKAPLQRLSSVTAELQERVMKTRMQPISTAWQKLPRLARDLSAELGKDIDLVVVLCAVERLAARGFLDPQ
jgi:two-component system chemotaxis sensor kinase CheA